MHIPSGNTDQVQNLSFEEALSDALLPHAEYDAEKWLFVPDYYTEYRYILGTRGKEPLICIGINPSTAAPDALDNTLKSVERIAHANGFDSWMMFNVYPQRATRPEDMERAENAFLNAENIRALRWALDHCGSRKAVWGAWGNNVERRPYLIRCLWEMAEAANEAGAVWYSAGKRSVRGHPHHPLYLKKDTPLELFDIREYLETLKI